MSAAPLPKAFAALGPFVAYWAADTLSKRDTRRLECTEEQRLAFYHAARDLAGPALDHLETRPLRDLEAGDRCLLNLMLSLIHVTLAVEVQRDGEVDHARGARRMPIVHSHTDPVHPV